VELEQKHSSYWIDSTLSPVYPKLIGRRRFDTIVIGSGIVGLTTAFLLKLAGQKVALLEARKLVEGNTGYTTAKITSQHGLIYDRILKNFGQSTARLYAQAQQSALNLINQWIGQYQISCDYGLASASTYTQKDTCLPDIEAEVRATQQIGIPSRFVSKSDLPYPIKGAVVFPNQAHFHPRKYLLHLASLVNGDGSTVFENSRALYYDESSSTIEVKTLHGTAIANHLVIATSFPVFEKGFYASRLTAFRSYALGVYVSDPIPQSMYITVEKPLFSVRPQPTDKGTMLIITGLIHPVGHQIDTQQCYQQLEKLTRQRFSVKSIDYSWSAQDVSTLDGLPYIGPYYPYSHRLYMATGFSGWGMTNGTAAAMLISDQILGRPNPWQHIFDPSRLSQLKESGQLIQQDVHVAKTFIKGHTSPAQPTKPLEPGQGRVIHRHGRQLAVYHPPNQPPREVSAQCTHMGCIVNFNNAEKTWDCPCHGSRFSTNGEVINAPAIKKLKSADG
jgi:glycine/D-amino acid oxidase-like deaminating enzyme/nitrite reductase/ring-hydroxylating ferredoxin subunit